MAREVKLNPSRTYATLANMQRAIADESDELRYITMRTDEGRFYPVFIGEQALQHGVHFRNFCVVG